MHLWTRITPVFVALSLLLSAADALAGDPTTVDCLSASEKSISLRTDHHLRSARAQLLVCASSNCPADIRKECTRRVDDVNTAIPTIVFGAKGPTGSDLTLVKVTMDGEVITEKLEGTAVSLDPGEHTFTFEAAGLPVLTKKILVREGEKERREMVQLGGAGAVAAPTPASVAPVAPAAEPAASKGLGTQKTVALVVAGVGVAGVAVGGIFGGLSMSKHGEAQTACPNAGCPTQAGVDLWNSARTDGNISTIAFIAGGVLVAGGAVLWFTAKKPAAPTVGLGPGSLTLREVW
jgi:hypothetical protein